MSLSLTRRRPLVWLWPQSLTGQIMLALALALLLAQAVSAVLVYRAQDERRQEALVHSIAFRVLFALRRPADEGAAPPKDPSAAPPPTHQGWRGGFGHHEGRPGPGDGMDGGMVGGMGGDGPDDHLLGGSDLGIHLLRPVMDPSFAPQPGDQVQAEDVADLTAILAEQGITVSRLVVVSRPLRRDATTLAHIARRNAMFHRGKPLPLPDQLLVAAVQAQANGPWLISRVFVQPRDPHLLLTLIGQTVLIYAVLVGTMALILGHITRPLKALTRRLETFAETRAAEGRLTPGGPDDVRRLIEAHNAMEARIIALIDEKDVMLGAIGHDLKTPLTALRVRIESVEDAEERARMAATIEDITRTLDDVLSLARVGRPSDPMESAELSSLVASIVEEFEDMGENVVLGDTTRIALPLRVTWARRALRNLVGNALRYGGVALVTVRREPGRAVVAIADEGPGIPEAQIARMLEPFTRGEPSRNSLTGGAGLGLTLARAIAEQHGGTLVLTNRAEGGLLVELALPLG